MIALVAIPGYLFLGEFFKIAMVPYLVYIVWNANPLHFPIILMHIPFGGTAAIFILIMCLVKTVANYKTIKHLDLTSLFWLSLLPAPVLLIQTIQRLFVMGFGFVDSFTPLAFYLGLFPFFYGVLLAPKIKEKLWIYLLNVLFAFQIVSLLPIETGVIRINSFTFSISALLVLFTFIPKRYFKIPLGYKMIGFLMIGLVPIGLLSFKFHTLFSVVFSFFLVYFYQQNYRWILSYLTKFRVIVFLVIIVAYAITASYDYNRSLFSGTEIDYTDFSRYPEYIQYKALGDRGVVWRSVWNYLISDINWLPPYQAETYNIISSSGGVVVEENEFGAHNIVLELWRNYGFIFGTIVSFSYIWMVLLLGKTFLEKNHDDYSKLFGASALGIAIVAGLTGQFVLMINFSFLLMGVMGLVFGRYKLINHYSNSEIV